MASFLEEVKLLAIKAADGDGFGPATPMMPSHPSVSPQPVGHADGRAG